MSNHDFSWIHLAFYTISPFVEPEAPWEECSMKVGKRSFTHLRGMSPSWSVVGFPQEDMILVRLQVEDDHILSFPFLVD